MREILTWGFLGLLGVLWSAREYEWRERYRSLDRERLALIDRLLQTAGHPALFQVPRPSPDDQENMVGSPIARFRRRLARAAQQV